MLAPSKRDKPPTRRLSSAIGPFPIVAVVGGIRAVYARTMVVYYSSVKRSREVRGGAPQIVGAGTNQSVAVWAGARLYRCI